MNSHGIPLRRASGAERPQWLNRGELLVIQGIFWSAGALFSVLLAWITLKYLDWHWYLFLSSVPLWFASVGVLFLPQSPAFLIADNRMDEAMDVIQQIAKYNGYAVPEGVTLRRDPKPNKGKISELWSKEYRDTTILLFFIYSMCVFSYYGWAFISVRYFAALDALYRVEKDLYWEMCLTTASEIPALGFGLLLINRLGRRGMMNLAFFLFAVTTYLLVVHEIQRIRWLGIALVFTARMWINLGFIGMGIYFVEFYRTEIRATAMGAAISVGRIMGIITTFTAESLPITLGLYLYGCSGLVAFMASILIEHDSAKIVEMRAAAEANNHSETEMMLPTEYPVVERRETTPIIN